MYTYVVWLARPSQKGTLRCTYYCQWIDDSYHLIAPSSWCALTHHWALMWDGLVSQTSFRLDYILLLVIPWPTKCMEWEHWVMTGLAPGSWGYILVARVLATHFLSWKLEFPALADGMARQLVWLYEAAGMCVYMSSWFQCQQTTQCVCSCHLCNYKLSACPQDVSTAAALFVIYTVLLALHVNKIQCRGSFFCLLGSCYGN